MDAPAPIAALLPGLARGAGGRSLRDSHHARADPGGTMRTFSIMP